MSGAARGEEGDGFRAWLAEHAPEGWPKWVGYVVGKTPVKDPSQAPDIVQEAVLRILAGEVRLPKDSKWWEGTLLRTLRNVARDHLKAAKVRHALPLEAADGRPGQVRDGRERGWRICRRLESKGRVAQAKECLTDDQWEVVALRYLKEWRIAEISEHRGCALQTVKNLLRRARAKLREKLDGG